MPYSSKPLFFLVFLVLTASGCSMLDNNSLFKEALKKPLTVPEEKTILFRPQSVPGTECRQIFKDPFGRDYFQAKSLIAPSAGAPTCPGEGRMFQAAEHIRLRRKAEEIKASPSPIPDVVVKSIKTGVYLYIWMATI